MKIFFYLQNKEVDVKKTISVYLATIVILSFTARVIYLNYNTKNYPVVDENSRYSSSEENGYVQEEAPAVAYEEAPALPAEIESQNVYIPDPKFKWLLLNNEEINTDSDKLNISLTEALAFNGELEFGGYFIKSLVGIEKFVNLTKLKCKYNQLTSLDLSKNTALKSINVAGNHLTSLILPKTTTLLVVICYENQLTSLDVTQNTGLVGLDCYRNQLTSLDVSQNRALLSLSCYSNQLDYLDLSQNLAIDSPYYHNNLPNIKVLR